MLRHSWTLIGPARRGTSLAPLTRGRKSIMKSRMGTWTVAVMLLFASAACKNTAAGLKRDAEENSRRAAEATEKARDRSAPAMERATDAAGKAADETAKAVGTAGRATRAAIETLDVKAALMADKRVDATGIDVDTNYETKTVVLKGHVPNALQRTVAGEIAAAKADGYKVRNELAVP